MRRSIRYLCAGVVVVFPIVLGNPAGAAGKEKAEAAPVVKRPAWGKVTGWVLDAATRKPVRDARVAVEIDGGFPESGKSTDVTEADGRFVTRAPLGTRSSKFDWGRVLTMSPLSLLVAPTSVTKQTRVISVQQINVRAEAPGYKPFLGRVRAAVADAGDYELTLDDIWLAPAGSELASFTPEQMGVEAVDSLKVEPPVAAPGEKVKITLTALLPAARGYKYRAYAVPVDKKILKSQPELKREEGAAPAGYDLSPVVFSREITLPEKAAEGSTEIGFVIVRDGDTLLRRRETKALLQVLKDPQRRAAAEKVAAGYAAQRRGDSAAALRHYEEARALDRGYALAHQLYGELALELNRPDQAEPAFKQLVELQPADFDQRARYAHALVDAGRPDEALAQLQDAEKGKGKKIPGRVWLYRARAYAAEGNFAEADKALARAGETIRISDQTLAEINLKRMATAVTAAPENPELRLSYARVLESARRREEAIEQARRAAALQPDQPWAFLDLGDLLLETGRREEGLRNLEHALKLAPANLEVQIALANGYRDAGRYADALPLYQKVAEAQRLNIPARHNYALMLYATGRLPEARKALLEVATLARDKGELQDKGIPFIGPGILGSGLYFGPKKRLVTGFSVPEAAADVAILDALEDLEKHPENGLLLQNIGAALLELNLPVLALDTLRRSRAADPSLAETPFLMGMAYRRTGDTARAREELQAALRLNPMHPRARLELAQLYTDAGELQEAQAQVLAHARCYPYDAPRP